MYMVSYAQEQGGITNKCSVIVQFAQNSFSFYLLFIPIVQEVSVEI